MFKKILYNVFLILTFYLVNCRAVKLPAVVRQTSHPTAAHRGGHSSAHVEPKPSGAHHSSRNKKNQNGKDPL